MTLEMSTLMGPGVEEEDVFALSGDAALRASLDSCVKCTIESTAASALASAIPSPLFSRQRVAPARLPPAAYRFGHTGVPSSSRTRMLSSTARPDRKRGWSSPQKSACRSCPEAPMTGSPQMVSRTVP